MISVGHSHWMITVKKYAYLLVVIPPALLVLSQWLWQRFGYPDLFAFFCAVFRLRPDPAARPSGRPGSVNRTNSRKYRV